MTLISGKLTRFFRTETSEARAPTRADLERTVADEGNGFGAETSVAGSRASQLWQRLAQRGPSGKQVGFASFIGLGTADVVGLSREVTRTSRMVGWLGVGGALGLIATSIHDLRSDKPAAEKWDAASNLAWGQQGLAKLSSSSLGLKAAIGLGVIGGVIQAGVGVARMRNGYRKGDRATIKLGALDVGSGLLWLGWDVLALEAPLFIASYVVVRVSREAYANRADLARFVGKTRVRAASAYEGWAASVESIAAQTARDVEDGLQLVLRPTLGSVLEGFRAGFGGAGAARAVLTDVGAATSSDVG